MAQKGLPYEYEIEEGKTGLTSFGGLPTYLDLASAVGFIDTHAFTGVVLEGFKLRLSLWEPALIPAFTGGEFPLY